MVSLKLSTRSPVTLSRRFFCAVIFPFIRTAPALLVPSPCHPPQLISDGNANAPRNFCDPLSNFASDQRFHGELADIIAFAVCRHSTGKVLSSVTCRRPLFDRLAAPPNRLGNLHDRPRGYVTSTCVMTWLVSHYRPIPPHFLSIPSHLSAFSTPNFLIYTHARSSHRPQTPS
jgi:hypothetical protein